MVEYRLCAAILFHEVEADIVIVSARLRIDLLPDALFDRLLLIRSNQVTKAMVGVREELLEITAAGELHELMICEQDLIIVRIRSVYKEGTWKMPGHLRQCEAELTSLLRLIGTLVRGAALLSMQLYGIERHIRVADQMRNLALVLRILRIAQRNVERIAVAVRTYVPCCTGEGLDFRLRLLGRLSDQNGRKFITAAPGKNRICAKMLPQVRCQGFQRLIPDIVPIEVVNELEIIDIHLHAHTRQ